MQFTVTEACTLHSSERAQQRSTLVLLRHSPNCHLIDHLFCAGRMQLFHHHGCVSSAPEHVPIVHAVSLCGRTGAGAAKSLHDIYDLRHEFRSTQRECPGLVPILRGKRLIINVITKERYFYKPISAQIFKSLLKLRDFLMFQGFPEIASTVFGCGRDQFPYPLLLQFLTRIFGGTPVYIHMHHFDKVFLCLGDKITSYNLMIKILSTASLCFFRYLVCA